MLKNHLCPVCMGYLLDYPQKRLYKKCVTCGFTKECYMIEMKELLNNKYKLEDQSEEIQNNLNELLDKMNQVRSLYGKPMVATSGLRTMEDHLRIYAAKGIIDQSKIPMHSKHLYGLALDIADGDGSLNQWCKEHEEDLRQIGIWLEIREGGWQHFQIRPYASYTEEKTIFFVP